MQKTPSSPLGRTLLVVANLFYGVGSFVADFSISHVYNPSWTPHAKFHTGQTMSLSALLASTSLFLVFRGSSSIKERQHDLFMAAVIGSLYCTAGLAAILYPGTAWADPDFEPQVKGAQGYLFALQLVLTWCGYSLESSKLVSRKKA